VSFMVFTASVRKILDPLMYYIMVTGTVDFHFVRTSFSLILQLINLFPFTFTFPEYCQ